MSALRLALVLALGAAAVSSAAGAVKDSSSPPGEASLGPHWRAIPSRSGPDFRAAAAHSFVTLWAGLWAPDGRSLSANWWRAGSYIDSLVDYLIQLDSDAPLQKETDAAFSLHGYAETSARLKDVFHTRVITAFDNAWGGWWYDDYAWWGIAFAHAAKHNSSVGGSVHDWVAPARLCWTLHDAGSSAWGAYMQEQALDTPAKWGLADWAPVYPGGCWQSPPSDLSPSDPRFPRGGTDPRKDAGNKLGGVQNTVTNALRLALAAKLHSLSSGVSGAGARQPNGAGWGRGHAPSRGRPVSGLLSPALFKAT
ncbi:hypothetical protein T484DRAFT_1906124, partial [Baffinella frigidus]